MKQCPGVFILHTLFCVLLLSLLSPPVILAQSQAVDFAAIDHFVEAKMQADRVPGLSLVLVHDTSLVYSKGFGVADPSGRPVTPQTPFLLGSMSKSFTALAIMQLVEAGKLNLDAPVQQYIPWFEVADPAASHTITLRHLLYHTSGIPTNAPRATGSSPSLADHVRALHITPLQHAPGTVHEYASPNYQILGLIVEEVSGEAFGAYIQNHIFSPLAMDHSFISESQAQQDGLASGYQYWFGVPVVSDLVYEPDRQPTASLIASAEDLGHYLIAQLNDGSYNARSVVQPQSMETMHQGGADGSDFSYAMGWRVGPINGVPAIHHGGIVSNYRGKMVMLPEQKWGVIVLTNISSFIGSPTSHDIADGVASMLAGQTPRGSTLNLSVIYLGLMIGFGLITLNQITGFFRLGRWRTGMVERLKSGAKARARIGIQLAIEFLIILGIIAVLPVLIKVPLAEVVEQVPDMSLWGGGTLTLAVMAVVIKLFLALSAFRMR